LLGADNPGAIRGIYLDGAILDEFAEMDTTIWGQVIRPALSDRLGWAIFIGTPKGQNHFYDIYNQAKEAGLYCSLIQDAGLTEFGGVPTYTAVAVGPAKNEDVDKITGELKLL